ncbi:DNA adenine methylase [Sulfuricurvum sp.]|uniref:DNA adenine methylase n=1 Tax=Sulfuricurvum sp. TaxID=2025608 RepID=UPI002D2B7C5D|nr:DNA adenine methylase [Sulfuricurvum sp.]HZF70949.1 DNA adenine methylase [Sulfuricurvum sp.]
MLKNGKTIYIRDYIVREEEYYQQHTISPTDYYNWKNPDGKKIKSAVLFEYVGNKRSFYKRTQTLLKERIESEKIETIVVPFTGSGSDFLNVAPKMIRENKKRTVVLNDLNPSIVNLFRTIRDDKESLIREIETIIKEQNSLVGSNPTLSDYQLFHKMLREELNDLELNKIMGIRRAALFMICMNTTFGGNYEWKNGRSHVGVATDIRKFQKYSKTIEKIDMYSFYMDKYVVIVENEDYSVILKRYDSSTTLFLIDPPYLKQDADVLVSTAVTYGNPDFPHHECINHVKSLRGQVIYHNYRNQVQTEMFEQSPRFKHVEHEKVINNQKSESNTEKARCVEVIYFTTDKKKKRYGNIPTMSPIPNNNVDYQPTVQSSAVVSA